MDFGKPAFDQIEPTGAVRNEVKREAGPLAQLGAHSRVTVDGIIVEKHVQAGRRKKLGIEPAQEVQKFLIAVTRMVLGDLKVPFPVDGANRPISTEQP